MALTSHWVKGARPRHGWKPPWADEWPSVPISLCKWPNRCSGLLGAVVLGRGFHKVFPFLHLHYFVGITFTL